MAKYVCDYEQLNSAATKLNDAANVLRTDINTYAADITNSLSSWDGSAKGSFTKQCEGQVKLAVAKADEATLAAEYIKTAVQEIQSTDEELASLKI